jgi:hypothetical protein
LKNDLKKYDHNKLIMEIELKEIFENEIKNNKLQKKKTKILFIYF